MIADLLDLSKTIAYTAFAGKKYPWEVFPDIYNFILELGPTLSKTDFDNPTDGIWIAKNANIFPSAYIGGPCIIDSGAEIRHCAFVRGGAIIGKNSIVGNSVEIKNSILFDDVQVPHYNYVGDSVLGYKAHMGAGAITSNVKADKTKVVVKSPDGIIDTQLKKFGAVLGDYAEIGCNSVLNPGTIIGRNTTIYPLRSVRGVIPANSIYKDGNEIIAKLQL